MEYCDLHLHSTASDGTQSPREIVAMASALGLAAVSLTDHDTADGCSEAVKAGKQFGITVITGVEINTEYLGYEVHLLGYGFDPKDGPLCSLLTNLREDREHRMAAMVERLQQQGLKVTLDEVYAEAKEGAIGRPHLARVLIRKGYVSSVKSAFDDLLAVGRPAYVPRTKLLPKDAIAAIHEAGAVSVVAHPALIGNDDVVEALVHMGVMGLEIHHTEHTPNDVERYRLMAERNNLLMTGGSDYHGPGGKEHGQIGMPRVPIELAYLLQQTIAMAKTCR